MSVLSLLMACVGAWAQTTIFTEQADGTWTLASFPSYSTTMTITYAQLPTITLPASLTNGTVTCDKTNAETGNTYADEDETVTLTATPNDGYTLKSLKATYIGASSEEEELTLTQDASDATKYTFEMPAADVTVTAVFDEAPFIIEADVDGQTVKTLVTVTKDEAAATVVITSAAPVDGSTIVAFPSTITVKEKNYTLTGFATDALKDQTAVTDIYLPDTDEPLEIATNALKIDDDDAHIASIHTPLALLDDYALNKALEQNYNYLKVRATVKPTTEYFTFSSGVDVLVPNGVKVYTCQLNDDGSRVLITELTREDMYMDGLIGIKANNGVLLSGTSGTAYDVRALYGRLDSGTAITTTDAKSYGDNLLEPVIESKHFAAGDYYVLYDDEFRAIQDNTSTVPACKAVLKKPAGVAASRSLGIGHADGTTGISGVQMTDDGAQIYTLQGQRVSASQLRKGTIYIQNGKKLTK